MILYFLCCYFCCCRIVIAIDGGGVMYRSVHGCILIYSERSIFSGGMFGIKIGRAGLVERAKENEMMRGKYIFFKRE